MKLLAPFLVFITLMSILFSCQSAKEISTLEYEEEEILTEFSEFLKKIDDEELVKQIKANEERFLELVKAMLEEEEQDSMLFELVDKKHLLDKDYFPTDLIPLDSLYWAKVNRSGHKLRAITIDALEAMVNSAKDDNVSLLISSCFRDYGYQSKVYNGWITQLGQEEADRLSAKPGTSQHQLGTALDFGPIDASFTGTPAQKWLVANAYKFGWSLSFPKGYEKETGYDYESWHYRYLGLTAIKMQQEFFDDLQYKLLEFWHTYHKEMATIFE